MTNSILKQVESGTYTNGKGVGTFAAHDVYPGANAPARRGVRVGDTNGISVQVTSVSRFREPPQIPWNCLGRRLLLTLEQWPRGLRQPT